MPIGYGAATGYALDVANERRLYDGDLVASPSAGPLSRPRGQRRSRAQPVHRRRLFTSRCRTSTRSDAADALRDPPRDTSGGTPPALFRLHEPARRTDSMRRVQRGPKPRRADSAARPLRPQRALDSRQPRSGARSASTPSTARFRCTSDCPVRACSPATPKDDSSKNSDPAGTYWVGSSSS